MRLLAGTSTQQRQVRLLAPALVRFDRSSRRSEDGFKCQPRNALWNAQIGLERIGLERVEAPQEPRTGATPL